MSTRRAKSGRWVPPARRSRPTTRRSGAQVEQMNKIREWVTNPKNRWKLLAGAAIIIAVLVALKTQRSRAVAGGAQVREVSKKRKKKSGKRRMGAQAAPVAACNTAGPYTPSAQPSCTTPASIPKPMNVYQDDLSGAHETSQSMMAPYSSAPVDYAGTCSGVNPSAVWQSTQLLPINCGQTLEGTSDWELYAPKDYEATNFLSAGYHLGTDTVQTSLKNANLQLRPEPIIPKTLSCPWSISTWGDSSFDSTGDWSHSLVA